MKATTSINTRRGSRKASRKAATLARRQQRAAKWLAGQAWRFGR